MSTPQVRRHGVWIVEISQGGAGMSGTGIQHRLGQWFQL